MASKLKIGVLYPQSAQFKTLSQDFIRGIKFCNQPAEFYMESIGIAADEKVIIEKIQKLQYQHDVDIIVGFTGHHKIEDVYQYVSDNNMVFIATDLGATLPFAQTRYNGVYINSYGINETSYLLGKYLIASGYSNIMSSTSYYDAGYGMLSAMEVSLSENDMMFKGHYITPFMPREDEAAQMENAISIQGTDAVFAFHSGLYAQEHAAIIKQTQLLNNLPYYLTPFTLDKNMFTTQSNNIFIVGSWFEEGDDELKSAFTQTYYTEFGKTPSVFAMLGYETSLMLNYIADNNSFTSYNEVINALNSLQVEGPRGLIRFDTDDNRTYFNHHIYKVTAYDTNNFSFKKMETLENSGQFMKKILLAAAPEKMGGWYNAYLCH